MKLAYEEVNRITHAVGIVFESREELSAISSVAWDRVCKLERLKARSEEQDAELKFMRLVFENAKQITIIK